jgi:hypothetical protein
LQGGDAGRGRRGGGGPDRRGVTAMPLSLDPAPGAVEGEVAGADIWAHAGQADAAAASARSMEMRSI